MQGGSGSITISGANLIGHDGSNPRLNINGNSGVTFTLSGTPFMTGATFNYDATNATVGNYTLTVSTTDGTSTPPPTINFVVQPSSQSQWPTDPCAVASSPNSGYSSFASAGSMGGGGNVTISLSGAAYSAVSQTVSYGPFSTPSSIASNLAALISANYKQYGLTARAFGPNIVYSGKSDLGTVNVVSTGPSLTPIISPAAEAAAGAACMVAPPTPPIKCGTPNDQYFLAVHRDSVSWIDEGLNHGREVLYELVGKPTAQYPHGAPVSVNSTITEHLDRPMSYGTTSSNAGYISGQFDDVLGSNAGPAYAGLWRSGRCFTVFLDAPFGVHVQDLGHVQTLDSVGLHNEDDIEIYSPIPPNKDGVTKLNGSQTSVEVH